MAELTLGGCRPEPLAHYLKALAVLRLLAEQADPGCRGWWGGDRFRLRSSLSRDELLGFFLQSYRPTPVIAPWNGGSGFYQGDRQDGIRALNSSPAKRFADYHEAIEDAREVLSDLGVRAKPEKGEKPLVLMSLRNRLSEKALEWLDAAVVLAGDEPKYPPILGTGGNDGRLDFTNNFMQRLVDLFGTETGEPQPNAEGWLRSSLFGEAVAGLQASKAIGQFYPGAAGGANATSGVSGDSLINPWDFVLTIEGALVFASSVTRRFATNQPGMLSAPFTVRAAGVGYGTATTSDEASSRGEMWLPLWFRPSSSREVAVLFSEGRAQVGRRQAVGGVDFARAIAGLGVDRGIGSFQRYGFQVRNGLAYFATPLGQWQVREQPEVDLLRRVDQWLDRFRRKASAALAPAGMARNLRRIEQATMDFCQAGGARKFATVLAALGEAERGLATSPKFREDAMLRPVPLLPAEEWLAASNDGSLEFRLAAALASSGLRENMEPVQVQGGRLSFVDKHPKVVWENGDLIGSLGKVLVRRLMDVQRQMDSKMQWPGDGRFTASLNDVAAFVEGRVDDRRVESLLWGFSLLNWFQPVTGIPGPQEPAPPLLYALLKLTILPEPLRDDTGRMPTVPAAMVKALSGDGVQASRLAARRLRASGFVPRVEVLREPPAVTRRIAAAMLIPVSKRAVKRLGEMLLCPREDVRPTDEAMVSCSQS